jgi:YYY domain-containing protein
MIDFLLWYLVILLLGWLAFPVAFRVFPRLKDRGFGLSKVLGLLGWGYIFWLTNMLGVNRNSPGGLLLALGLLALLSGYCLRGGRLAELVVWLRGSKRTVLFTEIVFLALFGLWAFMRATSPEVSGTEKPMELAFISAILRADSFPPHDPWLSGYAISYYYFGYVMAAMLIKITGTAAWVGFNLAGALWFALTGTAAFSLVYSLISGIHVKDTSTGEGKEGANLAWALLGPLYVLIVSNAEGFLEMLHSKGLFWQTGADGALQSKFWRWLNIQELVEAPASPFTWTPERPLGIWWWRASRVLGDYTAAGEFREVIDEFPFFSYYLADLHPHVLAMPFVILAIAFAFNCFLSAKAVTERGISLFDWAAGWFKGRDVPLQQLTIYPLLTGANFWLAAFVCGSLAFLNTWDFPIYVGLFGAVYVYQRYRALGWDWARLLEFVTFALLTGIAGVLFFFRFYIGFASQAGGLLPSLFFFPRGVQFWVMFLPLLVPLIFWLVSLIPPGGFSTVARRGIKFALIVLVGLGAAAYLFGWIGALLPSLGSSLQQNVSADYLTARLGQRMIEVGEMFFSVQELSEPAQLWDSLKLRLTQPGMWLTAGLLITLVWGLLSLGPKDRPAEESHPDNRQAFILLLILLGLGLVIFPEFFYLRDQFGYRINTIFKFYFQAWVLWAIAAAAASVFLWRSLKGARYRALKPVFGAVWTAVLLICLAYPFFGFSAKLNGLDWKSLSLNGARHIENSSPGEMQAIQWLLDAEEGVILEAVGGSYTGYARVSTFSGMPTVLGWPGHESQWRGGYEEIGSRESDIRQIYQSNDWAETLALLHKYRVNYVYIGGYEFNTYNVNEDKFTRNLGIAYQNESVRIYEVPSGDYLSADVEALP